MLVIMLCLSALGIGIASAEEIAVNAPAPEFETVDGGLSAKDAFEGYILQAFGQAPARRVLLKAARPLTGASGILYERVAALVKNVAAGKHSSTVCEISLKDLGITKTSYTAADLGIDSIFGGGTKPSEDAVEKFYNAVYADMGLDLALVGRKLRLDLPYDMYWASSSYMNFGGFSYSYDTSGTRMSVSAGGVFSYPVYVSAAYSVSGADGTTEFDTSRAEAVQQAAANAKAIVARYANASSDYGKLRGYKNAICDLVEYNHEAADNKSTPYGDPWQLVWVFDGDPSTKVVCEGYSKAFKYLCDMSSFTGDTSASSVTGWMSGGTGAGAHMWNLVSMNGVNYLVDVTNCDGDPAAEKVSVGYPDNLFMVGYSDTSDSADGTWYIYRVGQKNISYLYDDDIANLYAAEDIEVTTAGYEAVPYILASAEAIELGESVTLTMSVPEVDEDSFAIFCEQNGLTREIEGITPSYRQNEMILDFTPEAAGEYVFYAGYYENSETTHLTDASVRVTVTAPAPDPLTVITEGKIGTDVVVQVITQDGWDNLTLEIEYVSGDEGPELINRTKNVSDSFTIIGSNFLKPGTYEAILYRLGEVPEDEPEEDYLEYLDSVVFQMADQTLTATQGVLSADEITVGDELTFTCSGAEALAYQLKITDPMTGQGLWGTKPPIRPSAQGDTLTINYENTAGLLEGYIWAKEAGLWKQPQAIRVMINPLPIQLPAEELNMYFGSDSAEIRETIAQIALEDIGELPGDPVWTLERNTGTAEAQVIWEDETAVLSVTAFPDTAEDAVYTVRCACGMNIWEKQYTVHYLDLAYDAPEGIELISGNHILTAKAGDVLKPEELFRFAGGWVPAGGEPVKVSLEGSGLSRYMGKGWAVALYSGVFSAEAVLSFANVQYTDSFMLYVSESDGAIPLALNAPVQVSLHEGDEIQELWFSFIPEETGKYVFYSETETDNDDPIAALYDEEKNELTKVDDASGLNFLIEYELLKGCKYYYKAWNYEYAYGYHVRLIKSTGFSASPAGTQYIHVEYGESAVLEVEATSEHPEAITYQWLKNGKVIEGAAGSRLKIPSVTDLSVKYVCNVSDGIVTLPVDFYVSFDNHLYVSADPNSLMWEGSVDVANGAPAKMQVYASCAYGDLHFAWYNEDTGEIVPGSGDTAVCETSDYGENTRTYYSCMVSDDSGDSVSVYFTVYSDNHLTLKRLGEYVRSVPVYEDTVLAVDASCFEGGLTYEWSVTDPFTDDVQVLEGETSSELRLISVSASAYYTCTVKDEYGHQDEIDFRVTVDNQFFAKAVDGTKYNVLPGEDITLEVSAECLEGSLHYEWFDDADDRSLGTQSSLILQNLQENMMITCLCWDDFGNKKYIGFSVSVNHLILPSTQTRFNLDWGGVARMGVKLASETLYTSGKTVFYWSYSYDDNYFRSLGSENTATAYTTWEMDKSLVFRCNATYDDGNGVYISEFLYFYVNVAPRPATPGDLIVSPASGKKSTNMYYGAEGADISPEIEIFTVNNLEEVKEHQSGEPEWTVETVKGTGTAEVAFDDQKASASLKVKSFPESAETAKYRVKCVWDQTSWEQEIIVHYLELNGNPEPVIQPVSEGNFWIVQTGEPVDPKSCFTNCDWTPSGGESMKFAAEASPAVLEHFTVDPDSGVLTPRDPGGYDLNLKVSFANVSWSKIYTLYAARENGTVPVGSYRPQGDNTLTLTLPGGLIRIESEAFRGSPAEIVIIPEGCTEIGDLAFADMPNLKEIRIPSSVSVIGTKVFGESASVAVYANSEKAVNAALAYPGMLVLTE